MTTLKKNSRLFELAEKFASCICAPTKNEHFKSIDHLESIMRECGLIITRDNLRVGALIGCPCSASVTITTIHTGPNTVELIPVLDIYMQFPREHSPTARISMWTNALSVFTSLPNAIGMLLCSSDFTSVMEQTQNQFGKPWIFNECEDWNKDLPPTLEPVESFAQFKTISTGSTNGAPFNSVMKFKTVSGRCFELVEPLSHRSRRVTSD